MAIVGQQLTAPESGWRRYDNTDSRIKYTGTWSTTTSVPSRYFNSTIISTSLVNDYCEFKFYGAKFRLISWYDSNISTSVDVIIDDVTYNFSLYNATTIGQILVFEKLNLTLGVHKVKIKNNTTKVMSIDAIDIDSTGYLAHPILNQISDINSMQIGDCIPCRYTATTSGAAGYFSELGSCIKDEIPVTGSATPDGLFNLIKTAKGTLIADRVIQTNISWDVLNATKYIEGMRITECVDGIAFASPNTATDDKTPNKAFDRDLSDTGNWYCGTGVLSQEGYLGYIFNNPKVIREIWLRPHNNTTYSSECFKNFTVEGSNDTTTGRDGTWINISSGLNMTGIVQFDVFKLNNETPYKAIRIKGLTQGRGYIQISECYMFSNDKIIRSLSGGCAYIDANGDLSLTDKLLGAWPINNDWDKYIVNSDLRGKIVKGDDNIWHFNLGCLCKETPVNSMVRYDNVTSSNAKRIMRGILGKTNILKTYFDISNVTSTGYGFRPVLNYIESDIASEVI